MHNQSLTYQDAWYPGCVKEVGTELDTATVNCMAPTRNAGVFVWPARCDTQQVHVNFLIASGLVPEIRNAGRQSGA